MVLLYRSAIGEKEARGQEDAVPHGG